MEVLRMENDKGFGPFVASDSAEFVKAVPWAKATKTASGGNAIATDATHPHHMLDVPNAPDTGLDMLLTALGIPPVFKVGVKDKAQFLHWFPQSSLPYFESKGFHLSEYQVPDGEVKAGQYQVLFPTQSAKLVKAEPLSQVANDNSL